MAKTIHGLETELHEAIDKRVQLEGIVQEIHEKVNFDGGLVYQCDLQKLTETNTMQHQDILDKVSKRMDKIDEKLELIFPVVNRQIKKAEAWDVILNDNDSKLRSGKFWIQILVGISIVVGVIMAAVEYLSKIFK